MLFIRMQAVFPSSHQALNSLMIFSAYWSKTFCTVCKIIYEKGFNFIITVYSLLSLFTVHVIFRVSTKSGLLHLDAPIGPHLDPMWISCGLPSLPLSWQPSGPLLLEKLRLLIYMIKFRTYNNEVLNMWSKMRRIKSMQHCARNNENCIERNAKPWLHHYLFPKASLTIIFPWPCEENWGGCF